MKTMQKLLSVMVALVLVLALCVTAFAADTTGTITIDNPTADTTYTAYKIFDVRYDDAKQAYAYTIAANSEWYGVVNGYTGIKLTEAATGGVYIVEKNDNFSAAEFSNLLKDAISGKTGTTLTVADGKATATGLDLGYYLVVGSQNGTTLALANLTTTNPNVTIHDKNDVVFDKTDDKQDVQIGETVSYTITGKVPDTTGFKSYDYIITDTMSAGLTFQNDVEVFVDGVKLTTNYTLKTTDTGFELTIDVMKLQAQVTKEIKVTYTAVVNENAVATVEKNNAKLTYSNNPTNSESHDTRTDEEKVYSAKIVVDKYAENKDNNEDTSKKLAGAKFVLLNNDGKFYKYDKNVVSWVDTQEEATVYTTNDGGAVEFVGLKNGTYQLKEIEAPAGYNLLAGTVEVKVAGTAASESLTITSEVANSTGSLLPSTGGIGTQIFYIAGAALLLCAVIVLLVKKFKKAEN